MKSELAQAIADLEQYCGRLTTDADSSTLSEITERISASVTTGLAIQQMTLPALRATAKEMTRLVEENGRLRSYMTHRPHHWACYKRDDGTHSIENRCVCGADEWNSKRGTDETIICAAIRMPDGYIVRGHRHDSAMRTAGDIPRYKDVQMTQEAQGFVTSHNRFVGRKEAHRIHYGRDGMLFSEDLY